MADPGPPPGLSILTDADYRDMVDALLASRPSTAGETFWNFAYGSLIWKPAGPIAEQHPALLNAWHRKFCFRIARYRGCDERPGLMMTLDRGGACSGVIQRPASGGLREGLELLLRREFTYKPASQVATWVTVRSQGRAVTALTFRIDRRAQTYASGLPLERQAEMIAQACGHVGACAEYLMNTVRHLEGLGIHDAYLWRLQQLVAERIERLG